MNFEVDRYSSAWAHIALCADLTWASDQPDGFIVANQRLWTQHCRVNQVLQDTLDSRCGSNNHKKLSDQRLVGSNSKENGTCNKRSVKDVIPESRLAQFYGTFYYDDVRENCYTCTNEKNSSHYSSNSCENTDPTECWMLPEVEYWFRKLIDNSDRNLVPRRRRQYKMLVDDDLCLASAGARPKHQKRLFLKRKYRVFATYGIIPATAGLEYQARCQPREKSGRGGDNLEKSVQRLQIVFWTMPSFTLIRIISYSSMHRDLRSYQIINALLVGCLLVCKHLCEQITLNIYPIKELLSTDIRPLVPDLQDMLKDDWFGGPAEIYRRE